MKPNYRSHNRPQQAYDRTQGGHYGPPQASGWYNRYEPLDGYVDEAERDDFLGQGSTPAHGQTQNGNTYGAERKDGGVGEQKGNSKKRKYK